MRDVHCHILPGVDDGARTMSESLLMLSAAMKAGVTSIVCTPRCCDPWFNFEHMWQAFLQLKHRASAIPGAPELSMGFEVDYYKLKKLGMDAAVQLGNDQGEFLLQLPEGALPLDWEYLVRQLQRKGFKVIIAHPERCREVQRDVEVARRFLFAGCELQISADCVYSGPLDPSRRAAKKLVQAGMVAHLASDARRPSDYELLTEAMEYFKRISESSDSMENKSIEEVELQCAQAEERAERRGRGASFAPMAEPASQSEAVSIGGNPSGPAVSHAAPSPQCISYAPAPSAEGGAPVLQVPELGRHEAAGQMPCSEASFPGEPPLSQDGFEEEPIRGKHARLS